MNNADMPAMPVTLPPGESFRGHCPHDGLTKREHIASMAMQGLLASWGQHDVTDMCELANDAVFMADTLLAKLEKQS